MDDDPASKLPDIDPSKLEITKSITPKTVLPNEDLIFGRTFTGELQPIAVILTD
jgi:branched-chain amino acid aminotransferase